MIFEHTDDPLWIYTFNNYLAERYFANDCQYGLIVIDNGYKMQHRILKNLSSNAIIYSHLSRIIMIGNEWLMGLKEIIAVHDRWL